ncbi:MAG: aa3-type cytochrome c oxidase subunit IV [Robiginitomaculum sp.]|nr:aa3-type cytochrome c oxidase subunit IV [Robiginitomaculum sp.]
MGNYVHGEQDISAQRQTYSHIINITTWSAALLCILVLFFSLVFAAKMAWFPALIISFVTSVVIGMILKLSGAWYGVMIGLSVCTLIVGFAVSLVSGA